MFLETLLGFFQINFQSSEKVDFFPVLSLLLWRREFSEVLNSHHSGNPNPQKCLNDKVNTVVLTKIILYWQDGGRGINV